MKNHAHWHWLNTKPQLIWTKAHRTFYLNSRLVFLHFPFFSLFARKIHLRITTVLASSTYIAHLESTTTKQVQIVLYNIQNVMPQITKHGKRNKWVYKWMRAYLLFHLLNALKCWSIHLLSLSPTGSFFLPFLLLLSFSFPFNWLLSQAQVSIPVYCPFSCILGISLLLLSSKNDILSCADTADADAKAHNT